MKFSALCLKNLFTRAASAVIGASALLAIALPTPVIADTTGFHGTICQPKNGSQADEFNHYSGGIRNTYGAARWVVCPLDRQEGYSTSGKTTAYVYFYNYNVVGYDNTKCYFRARSAYGSTLYTDVKEVTTTGNKYMWLQVPPSGYAYYQLECRLSPYTYLRSIYLIE